MAARAISHWLFPVCGRDFCGRFRSAIGCSQTGRNRFPGNGRAGGRAGPWGGAVRGGVCAGWACGPSGLITFLLTPPVCDSSVLCPTRRKSAASCALCRRDGELGGGELRCSRVSVLRSASGPTAAISCLTYLNRNLMRE